jgi:hypothetical protein
MIAAGSMERRARARILWTPTSCGGTIRKVGRMTVDDVDDAVVEEVVVMMTMKTMSRSL